MTPWYHNYEVKFKCQQCGRCCLRKGIIYFSVEDIRKASEYLEMTIDDFDKKYLIHHKDMAFIRVTGHAQPCPFHNKDKSCRIHDAKPEQCKSYPIWPSVIKTKQSYYSEQMVCKGIGKGNKIDIDSITKFDIPSASPQEEEIARALVSCGFHYRPDSKGKCYSTGCMFASVRGEKIKSEGCEVYKVVQEMEKES